MKGKGSQKNRKKGIEKINEQPSEQLIKVLFYEGLLYKSKKDKLTRWK